MSRFIAGDDHRQVGDGLSCVCGRTCDNAQGLHQHIRRAQPVKHGTLHAYLRLRCRCEPCCDANAERKRDWEANHAPPDGTLRERDERAWNGRVGAEYGCTVTFENGDGQTLTLSRRGRPEAAFEAMCAEAWALDATYRVVSYSTPQTILSDLRGTRVAPPEAMMANRLGMAPIVHERLRRGQRDFEWREEEIASRDWRPELLAEDGAT